MMDQTAIRNFCIIAHIDHGKSTLADRLLEICGTLSARDMRAQVLDSMDLERERGITIKSHPIRLRYQHPGGIAYQLNLIDTPGHVDFTYEVSRSLAACEGAVLVVDGTQGVEAQTLSNYNLAVEAGLVIVPVVNKVDLDRGQIEAVIEQMTELIGCEEEEILRLSAKTGKGVPELLGRIVERIPAPSGSQDGELRALVFDSLYDNYRGVVTYVRVVDGTLRAGETLRFIGSQQTFEVTEAGQFRLRMEKQDQLSAGEVGYMVSGIKDIREIPIGDTLTRASGGPVEPLPGYREVKPVVFCGLYPIDPEQYEDMRAALEKLQLNDSSFNFVPESSNALGQGFRCGFLGLLHMEITRERLEREFDLSLISSFPQVDYKVVLRGGSEMHVDNPANFPDRKRVEKVLEPIVRAEILTPAEYLGTIMKLVMERRGEQKRMLYLSADRVVLTYDLPLAEILTDFHDRLKSSSRGHASFDYDVLEYRETETVRLDVHVNAEPVDALSVVVHKSKVYRVGRDLVDRLKELIPRQQFPIAIQAIVGSKAIARADVKAVRKNVTAKCYGGDITRKRKLLERQKEGKKKLKRVGNVDIPQEAFMAVMSLDR